MSQPASDPIKPLAVLGTAVWFALVTGLLEAVYLIVRDRVFGKHIGLGPDLIWMAPVTDLLWFGALAVPMILLVLWLWPRRLQFHVATGAFAFLAFSSLVLLYPRMHRIAALILAAGLTAVAIRLIARNPAWFAALIRRTLAGLIGAVVAAALSLFAWQWYVERRAVDRLPAASAGAPNVLLLVLDTVRAMNLSLYGYPRPTTPVLEQWAQGGTVFKNAIVTASWTLPSHGSIFTGRQAAELKIGWGRPLDTTYPTLAETLQGRGYLTAGFVANLLYCQSYFGLDRGFLHYEDFPLSFGEFIVSTSLGRTLSSTWRVRRILGYYEMAGRKSARELNADFLSWLAQKGPRPFFAFLNYYDAHEPYLPPAEFDRRFASATPRKNYLIRQDLHLAERARKEEMSPAEIQREMDAYDATIASIDQQIGALLDELSRQGVLDNTLVIITSDHGEQFGEHKLFEHGNSVYRQLLGVPLVLRFPPRVPAGVVVKESVSLRDLPATVLDLLGLQEGSPFPGQPLARFWASGAGLAPEPVLSEVEWRKKTYRSLTLGAYHFIRLPDGTEELYDLDRDPFETTDMTNGVNPTLILGFRATLDSLVAEASPVRATR